VIIFDENNNMINNTTYVICPSCGKRFVEIDDKQNILYTGLCLVCEKIKYSGHEYENEIKDN
jgi:hypothetical protein